MCGIIGYVGERDINAVLLSGLWKLEYRGYDSAGVAGIGDGELEVRKVVGRLNELNKILDTHPISGKVGIGHTRWATHGEPIIENAHPHIDCKNLIAVVHNGIIENFLKLKEKLIKRKHLFRSFTDTEVVAHLIEEYYKDNLEEAIRKVMEELEGEFAIAVICAKEPNKIVCFKKNAPLIIGKGEGENLVASDKLAILGLTRKMIILEDYEVGVITKERVWVKDKKGRKVKKSVIVEKTELIEIEKGEYPHFMAKEIHEQPIIIENILKKRVKKIKPYTPFNLTIPPEELAKLTRIIIQACGTSWHAGCVGKYLLETFCRIHTEVDISSEFRYRKPVMSGDTLVIAISQSGETADTIAGLREAKVNFMKVLSIVNVVGSTIARESDDVIYIDAGPEIGVASTKAYTAQLMILYLLSIYLSTLKWLVKEEELAKYFKELKTIPDKMRKILKQEDKIIKLAKKYYKFENFIFLGRGVNYPSALEGALKLKEISYIHTTGYPAGEMKHGPIALIDEKLPVVCINPKGSVYEKMLNNMEEVKTRKGKIIAIVTEGDERVKKFTNDIFYIPRSPEALSPILVALPLQLLAYHIAVLRGLDVDKPRNLAKSVTVE